MAAEKYYFVQVEVFLNYVVTSVSLFILSEVFADIIDKHKETYSEKFSRGFVDAYVKEVKKGTPHFSVSSEIFKIFPV